MKDTARLDRNDGSPEPCRVKLALRVARVRDWRQMPTQLPRSDHASEDIHEQRDIEETSVEADVGDIANPDLIGSTDLKVLNSIDPGTLIFKGSRGLTDAFHRYREIFFFHQPGKPVYIRRCIPDAGAML